ncbi:MAG: MBL fold metallo-hydrolase [Kiritimatiellia bacterium]
MTEAWAGRGGDAAWLMGPANYLARTMETRWAVDPVMLTCFVPQAITVDPAVLSRLDFILLTHRHRDHMDPELWSALAGSAIRWIVPGDMLVPVCEAGVPQERITPAEAGVPLDLQGMRITPFAGLHWEYAHGWQRGSPRAGIDATGYFVEWDGHSLLFPGDTRTYDPAALPVFSGVQTLVAHVWLGRKAAGNPRPPLLADFCGFVAALKPCCNVWLTHLWNVVRKPYDYWDERHARLIRDGLHDLLPGVTVAAPEFWRGMDL